MSPDSATSRRRASGVPRLGHTLGGEHRASPDSARTARWAEPRLHAWLPTLLPRTHLSVRPRPVVPVITQPKHLCKACIRPGGGRRAIHRRLVVPTTLYCGPGRPQRYVKGHGARSAPPASTSQYHRWRLTRRCGRQRHGPPDPRPRPPHWRRSTTPPTRRSMSLTSARALASCSVPRGSGRRGWNPVGSARCGLDARPRGCQMEVARPEPLHSTPSVQRRECSPLSHGYTPGCGLTTSIASLAGPAQSGPSEVPGIQTCLAVR